MTPMKTQIQRVLGWFTDHANEWHTIAEVASALDMTKNSARVACRTLHRKRLLICSQDPAWAQRDAVKGHGTADRRSVAITFRTRQGYMASSRFERGDWVVEVIWLGDEPIVGPFCKHCGNPASVHGPQRECLNYRVHSVLPVGDLPKPERRS